MVPVLVFVQGKCTHTAAMAETEFAVARANRCFLSRSKRTQMVEECVLSNISRAVRCRQAKAVMTEEDLAGGNTTACQTAHVISQAIYEHKKKQHLHGDINIELLIIMNV